MEQAGISLLPGKGWTSRLALLGCLAVTAPAAFTAEPASEPDELRPAAPFIREGSFNQDPANGKLKGKMLRIKRPLLIVKNLERSVEFYVDVIGLELYSIEDTYNRDPASLGYEMFNITPGSRKRMALLNTSDEVRGMTLQEVLDMDFEVAQHPRTSTILFETDELLAIRSRASVAGFPIVEPVLGHIPATDKAPELRFMEFGIIDPDGHAVAFFQYFNSTQEWEEAQKVYQRLVNGTKAD
jgi:catechol 2,3-dioxygenase-like lactoylglutathione lyase family enzyme